MDANQKELSQIKEILKANPRGATVTEIARNIKLNRNSASKYLEMLVLSGQIERKMQGPSKVYFLSRRVPISAMLSFSSDMILVLDHELRIRYANDKFVELISSRNGDVVGKLIGSFGLTDATHSKIISQVKEALNGKEIMDEFHTDLPGSLRYIKGRFVPTVLEDGQAGVTAIFEDITEHKRAEEALRASEKKYRQLVEFASEGIWMLDLNEKISFANPRMAQMLGYSIEEMMGSPLLRFYLPADHDLIRRKLDMRRQGYDDQYDIPLVRKDGSTIFANIKSTPMKDDDGNYSGVFALICDITDRKKAEEALKASELKYRQLVDLAQEGIWAIDRDARITFVNPRMAVMLGYKQEEMIGRPLSDFIKPGREMITREYIRRRQLGINERHESPLLTKDGRIIQACMSASPVIDEQGEYAGAIALVTDITESRRMEEALKKAHEELQAMVSDQTKELVETTQVLRQEIAERKLIEEALRLDEARLEALMTLNAMTGASVQEMADFAIEKAIEITGSKYGLINKVDEASSRVCRFSYTRDVFRICQMEDQSGVFHLDSGGMWSRPVVERKPIIVNDYKAYADKKGVPGKHFLLRRLLGIPVIVANQVVAVAMVANKETEYTAADARQLTLLMNGLWKSVIQKQAEEALRESEENFRQLAENITEVFWICSPDWKQMYYVSPAYEHIWGRPVDSLYREPRSWLDIVHPEDRQLLEANMEKRKRGDWSSPSFSEYRLSRPDGTARWILARTYPVRDELGAICRIAGLAEDITERKQIEDALRESEEKFRIIVENANEGIFVADQDFRITYCNQNFADMVGYTIQELQSETLFRFLDQGCNSKLHANLEKRRAGLSQVSDFKFRHKDGTAIWVISQASPIFDRKGIYAGTICLITDITERKRIEAKLLESEQTFRYTFDQSPLGAAILDLDCRYTRVNVAFCQLLGYSADELLKRTMPDITYKDDVEPNLKLACKMAAGKLEEYHLEKRFVRKDGRVVWARQWSRMVRDVEGKPLYYLALIEDIDERKRIEEKLMPGGQQESS